MSISSEISRLTQAKADIKTAIENKGVTVPSSAKLDDYPDYIDDIEQGSTPNLQTKSVNITENGTTTVEPDPGYDGLSEVGVSVNVQGGGGGASDDVRFLDYDGTVLHTYSTDDFLSLTSMPENPTHEGLTSQGWNWTLADAKAQVQSIGKCDIGQLYVTNDGKTRLYIELHGDRLIPWLGICPDGTVEIDWGDGTNPTTVTGTSLTTQKQAYHIYEIEGEYIISLSVSGSFSITGSGVGTYLLRKSSSTSLDNGSRVYSNALKKVECGNSVVIGNFAFCSCFSLQTITISKNTTFGGSYAFYGCSALKCLIFSQNLQDASSFFKECQLLESVSLTKDFSLSNTEIFRECHFLSRLIIPKDCSNIGSYVFYNCRYLDSIIIPEGVKTISSYAFYNCFSFLNVKIPDGVTTIGDYAFSGCDSLLDIEIPNTVTIIKEYAFSGCRKLSEISIPSNVTFIGRNAFNFCRKLNSINIPSGITTIPANLLSNCESISSIEIPHCVTSIGANAFQNCFSLSDINIPDSVTTIGNYAFSGCYSIKEITLPDSVTSIGTYAFQGCSVLSEVNIPELVTSIGNNTFSNCYGLSHITIPIGVSSIGNNAFNSCYGMMSYHFLSETPPTLGGSSVFSNIQSECKIYVPAESLGTYKSAQYWSTHSSKMVGE